MLCFFFLNFDVFIFFLLLLLHILLTPPPAISFFFSCTSFSSSVVAGHPTQTTTASFLQDTLPKRVTYRQHSQLLQGPNVNAPEKQINESL